MEFLPVGAVCAEKDCRINDFLPFWCARCEKCFCSSHRSRFQHTCVHVQSVSSHSQPSEGPSSADICKMVTERHDNMSLGSEKEHFAAISTNTPVEKSQFLSRLSNPSAARARNILLKKYAKGDENIQYEDRLYVMIEQQHREANEGLCVYMRRSHSLQDALHELSSRFTSHQLSSTLMDSTMSLSSVFPVIATTDTPDWKEFNPFLAVSELLSDFETITINFVALTGVAENNSRWQAKLATPIEVVQPVETLPAIAAVIPEAIEWKQYDLAVYKGSDSSALVVSIASVHHDDYPNVYYTIKPFPSAPAVAAALRPFAVFPPHATFSEKQTTPGRLSSVMSYLGVSVTQLGKQSIVSLPLKDVFTTAGSLVAESDVLELSFQVTHGNTVYEVSRIPSSANVGMLRYLLMLFSGVPFDRIRLISKGTALTQHDLLLEQSKLADGAKVTMIGSK